MFKVVNVRIVLLIHATNEKGKYKSNNKFEPNEEFDPLDEASGSMKDKHQRSKNGKCSYSEKGKCSI